MSEVFVHLIFEHFSINQLKLFIFKIENIEKNKDIFLFYLLFNDVVHSEYLGDHNHVCFGSDVGHYNLNLGVLFLFF